MNSVRVVCCCCCRHFASSINLKIGYVLQIGWNYPKKHFKISQKYFGYGFGGLKSGYFAKIGCFWAKCKFQNGVRGGIRPPENFIFEIRLVRYLGHPFAKLWVLGRPTAPYNTILRKNVPCKNGLLGAKYCN